MFCICGNFLMKLYFSFKTGTFNLIQSKFSLSEKFNKINENFIIFPIKIKIYSNEI